MCSPDTFRVTFSVVCNDSFLSQNAFPFRWWVNVSFAFLLFCCFSCAVPLAAASCFPPGGCPIFSEEFFSGTGQWSVPEKNSSEKNSISTQRTKIHRKPKNKQTSERTVYYEGTGEHPKASKRQGEPKEKR